MEISFTQGPHSFKVDLKTGIDCSSVYGLPRAEPAAWHCSPVKVEPVQNGDWVGSVQAGAPINFYQVQLNPHGNGTHTECVGHISAEKQSINEVLPGFQGLLRLVRLAPDGQNCVRLADFKAKVQELVEPALAIAVPADFPQDFSGTHPPYFEPELMRYLRQAGVHHFITNLPSVDPEEDDGALAAHKAFWNYPQEMDLKRTITELAHFKTELKEGQYFLNLQVAPLQNDAAPSRVMLHALSTP